MDSEIQVQVRSYISYFDEDDTFPWHHDLCQEIERRRALLTDSLIFDGLLSQGGVREPDTLFPPRDVEQLEQLLDAISTSKYDQLKRDCLVYFLLKYYQDGREAKFQLSRCLPPQFCALSDAYWLLDAGTSVEKAVAILANPRLNSDFASKILVAISHSDDPATLIIRYVRTAKPRLVEQDDIAIYTLALAEKQFHEAWQFQRSFNEEDETRPRLVKKIFEWAVTPSPRPTPLAQLVGLPMSPYEQSIFHAYALYPPTHIPPKSIAVLQDLVCVRLIENGQYADAVKLDRKFTSVSPLKGHAHLTQERSQMVRDIYNALSQVERAVLDLELDIQDKAGDVVMSESRPMVNGHVSPDRSAGFRVIPSAALNKSQNGHAGRKSLGSNPLTTSSNTFMSSTSSNPFMSSTSSNITVSQPQASTSSSYAAPPSSTFESASRRQNAFFQPQKPKDAPVSSPFTLAGLNGSANGNGHGHGHLEDIGMDEDEDHDMEATHQPPPPPPPPALTEMSFSKSVFDSLPPAPQSKPPNRTRRQKTPPAPKEVAQMKRSIPGGFMDDDDEEEDEEVAPLPRAPSPPKTRKGRSSVSVESEGRRRSSRLSHSTAPAPPPEPKKRKAAATTTKSTTRKKRS